MRRLGIPCPATTSPDALKCESRKPKSAIRRRAGSPCAGIGRRGRLAHLGNERDYVRAHWLLGAAHRVAGQFDEAEHNLHYALKRCRRIGGADFEADILIDLARLGAATGAPDDAQRLAEEALVITDRSGYVLQGADAHLELAKLALARGDKSIARHHATEARRLATCDGPPDYTYKAAYDEAGALLKKLRKFLRLLSFTDYRSPRRLPRGRAAHLPACACRRKTAGARIQPCARTQIFAIVLIQ